MSDRVARPAELFRTPIGIAVGLLSLFFLLYGVIALGNVLISLFAVVVLVGGYVLVHVLLRLVTALERLAAAHERSLDQSAGETEASLPESSERIGPE